MKYLVPALSISILALTIGVFARPGKTEDVLSRIARYRDWTRVNAHPAKMDPIAAAMCSYPSHFVSQDPHTDHFVTVYVNDAGRRAMMMKGPMRFPTDSIIVKEKLIEKRTDRGTPEVLTVMIKRYKGFNPKVGDWEFLLLSGDAKHIAAQGKLESCQNCHLTQAKQDYVYGTYKQN